MPSSVVRMNPPGSRPGVSSLAITPTTSPNRIQSTIDMIGLLPFREAESGEAALSTANTAAAGAVPGERGATCSVDQRGKSGLSREAEGGLTPGLLRLS